MLIAVLTTTAGMLLSVVLLAVYDELTDVGGPPTASSGGMLPSFVAAIAVAPVHLIVLPLLLLMVNARLLGPRSLRAHVLAFAATPAVPFLVLAVIGAAVGGDVVTASVLGLLPGLVCGLARWVVGRRLSVDGTRDAAREVR